VNVPNPRRQPQPELPLIEPAPQPAPTQTQGAEGPTPAARSSPSARAIGSPRIWRNICTRARAGQSGQTSERETGPQPPGFLFYWRPPVKITGATVATTALAAQRPFPFSASTGRCRPAGASRGRSTAPVRGVVPPHCRRTDSVDRESLRLDAQWLPRAPQASAPAPRPPPHAWNGFALCDLSFWPPRAAQFACLLPPLRQMARMRMLHAVAGLPGESVDDPPGDEDRTAQLYGQRDRRAPD